MNIFPSKLAGSEDRPKIQTFGNTPLKRCSLVEPSNFCTFKISQIKQEILNTKNFDSLLNSEGAFKLWRSALFDPRLGLKFTKEIVIEESVSKLESRFIPMLLVVRLFPKYLEILKTGSTKALEDYFHEKTRIEEETKSLLNRWPEGGTLWLNKEFDWFCYRDAFLLLMFSEAESKALKFLDAQDRFFKHLLEKKKLTRYWIRCCIVTIVAGILGVGLLLRDPF